MPLPNHAPCVPYSQAGNWVYRIPDTKSSDTWSVRLDQVLTQKQNIFFRYNSLSYSEIAGRNSPAFRLRHFRTDSMKPPDRRTRIVRCGSRIQLRHLPDSGSRSKTRRKLQPVYDRNLSSDRRGRKAYLATFPFTPDIRALLGSPTNILTISTLDDEPRNAANYNYGNGGYEINGNNFNTYNQTNFQGSIALTKILGRHSIKFGYEGRRYYDNLNSVGQNNYFSVDGNATQQYVASNNANNLNWGNNSQAAANGTGQFLMGIDTWMQVQVSEPTLLPRKLLRQFHSGRFQGFTQTDVKPWFAVGDGKPAHREKQ